MRKLNIFFPYCGETMGGSHISSLTLIENLKKKNFVVLVGIHRNGIFKNYCKKKKIKFNFLNKNFFSNSKSFLNNFFYLIFNFFYFYYFLKKNKIDIIHINDYRMLNTWALSSYLANVKKIIFHQRNPVPNSRWVKINLMYTSNIISISKFVFSTLSNKLKTKSKIIHNPIKKIKLRKRTKKNLIGFVGNYSKRKRPEIFFKFAKALINQNTKFKFIFIGNIANENIQTIYENYPIFKRKLIFTKFLMNPFQKIQRCKLIICPSKNEGFGRVPLEAGYLNVPSLVSFSGGHKEFKKYNLCLFVKRNHESEYLKVFKQALKTKVRKTLIKNILEYNHKYTLPKLHAKKVIEIYYK